MSEAKGQSSTDSGEQAARRVHISGDFGDLGILGILRIWGFRGAGCSTSSHILLAGSKQHLTSHVLLVYTNRAGMAIKDHPDENRTDQVFSLILLVCTSPASLSRLKIEGSITLTDCEHSTDIITDSTARVCSLILLVCTSPADLSRLKIEG